jgi:quinol monooxygenase YgiN
MILTIIEMNARPAKRKELSQTLHAIIQQIRNVKGCTKCSACQDIENENIFSLIEEWETKEHINSHLRSELFTVLLGAKNLLSKPLETSFRKVSSTSGMKAVKTVRGKTHES